jgi:hypothetical protein
LHDHISWNYLYTKPWLQSSCISVTLFEDIEVCLPIPNYSSQSAIALEIEWLIVWLSRLAYSLRYEKTLMFH